MYSVHLFVNATEGTQTVSTLFNLETQKVYQVHRHHADIVVKKFVNKIEARGGNSWRLFLH